MTHKISITTEVADSLKILLEQFVLLSVVDFVVVVVSLIILSHRSLLIRFYDRDHSRQPHPTFYHDAYLDNLISRPFSSKSLSLLSPFVIIREGLWG